MSVEPKRNVKKIFVLYVYSMTWKYTQIQLFPCVLCHSIKPIQFNQFYLHRAACIQIQKIWVILDARFYDSLG